MYWYFSEERKGVEMVTGNLKGRKRKRNTKSKESYEAEKRKDKERERTQWKGTKKKRQWKNVGGREGAREKAGEIQIEEWWAERGDSEVTVAVFGKLLTLPQVTWYVGIMHINHQCYWKIHKLSYSFKESSN